MKKWEYKVVDSKDVPRAGVLKGRDRAAIESYLNRFGADGWELVNMDLLQLEGRTDFVGWAKRELTK